MTAWKAKESESVHEIVAEGRTMGEIAPPVPTTPDIEAKLSLLEKLPYWERRLLFSKKSPDKYPRFFYKFFPFDPNNAKLVRNLRDVVVESRFWLADHERFNDPFDLRGNYVFEGTPAEKRARLEALVASQNPGAPRWRRIEILHQMMARSDADWGVALKDIFRRKAKEIGVWSFATDFKPPLGTQGGGHGAERVASRLGPRSILMWAHYARSHGGVCLQFETILSPRVLTYAQEVQYSDEYPRVNYINNFQDNIFLPLVRKHKGWEYEKEWRILHITGVRRYLPFDPRALRRLIFGCRATPEEYAAAEALLDERERKGHPPVELFRAVQHPTEYRLLLWCLGTRKVAHVSE